MELEKKTYAKNSALCWKIKSLAGIQYANSENVSWQNSQFIIFKDDIKVKNFTSMVAHTEGHYKYDVHLYEAYKFDNAQ